MEIADHKGSQPLETAGLSATRDGAATERVVTIPNVLSIARLVVLLPLSLFLLLTDRYVLTLVALFLLGATDWLDGYLARRLDQQSTFGKNLDVIADRVSIVFIGAGLAVAGLIQWWMIVFIAAIDAVVALIAWLLYHGPPTIRVSMAGKVRTALLLFGLPGLILAAALNSDAVRQAAVALVVLGLIFQVIAAAGYIYAMLKDSGKI